jgi:polyphosphate kinase 2 (PPK2 family)|tara:strand:- start:728 stop:1015 length:288 start_codon:yes stop_codon:yes gene_type:complete
MAKSKRGNGNNDSASDKVDSYREDDPRLRGKKEKKLSKVFYESELFRLQVELVKLQEWVKENGLKIVIVFEGRDAAGKGGVIKRIIQHLNPEYAM